MDYRGVFDSRTTKRKQHLVAFQGVKQKNLDDSCVLERQEESGINCHIVIQEKYTKLFNIALTTETLLHGLHMTFSPKNLRPPLQTIVTWIPPLGSNKAQFYCVQLCFIVFHVLCFLLCWRKMPSTSLFSWYCCCFLQLDLRAAICSSCLCQ